MDSPFDSPFEVLDRARVHINDLASRIQAFANKKPYTLIVDYDASTGQDVHKLRFARIPGSLAAIAKDAFSNLRDALDHAVYASAVSLRPGNNPTKTAFPFARDAMEVHNRLNTDLTDVPAGLRDLLEDQLPYKGGNDILWGLNQTRNIKTHRCLVPLGIASMQHSTHFVHATIVGGGQFAYQNWDAEKLEAEFLRVGRGSKLHYIAEGSFDVRFGDLEVFSGKPAVPTLDEIANEVERIVKTIQKCTMSLVASNKH